MREALYKRRLHNKFKFSCMQIQCCFTDLIYMKIAPK